MTMTFQNMVLAWALALVAIPILLHLFARSRPPVYRFSSVEFIRRVVRSTLRVRRPQDIILLILRTLFVGALVLVFLQPLLFAGRKPGDPFQRKNVVVIVDATASMGCVDGAQTRFAAACAEASEILKGLTSRDRADVVWLDSDPEAVFPELGVNFGFLQNALRRARVTGEAGNVGATLQLAFKLLEGAEGRREVYVVSDFQVGTWFRQDIPVPPSVEVVRVKVGDSEPANSGISDIHFSPARPLAGEDVTVYCDVHNYSAQPRQRTVFLSFQETRQSEDILVPAWGKGTAAFRCRASAPGLFAVSAALTEDTFIGDDRRWALMTVREHLTAGFFAPGNSATVWHRVVDALQWVKPQTLSATDLAGDQPLDILLVAGWEGAARSDIQRRLNEKTLVVCYPAANAKLEPVAALTGRTGPAGNTVFRREESEKGWRIRVKNEKDELLRLFADGRYGDPARGLFRTRLAFPAAELPGAEVIFAYEDGVPALARFGKHFYLWNLSLDPEGGNWAGQKEFLPFMAELMLTARESATGASEAAGVPGLPAVWRFEENVLAADVSLKDEAGATVTVTPRTDKGGALFASSPLANPGLYTWEHKGRRAGISVVNFPAGESDLRSLSRVEMGKGSPVVSGGGTRAREMREGMNLWPYLLALGIVVAMTEGVFLLMVERK